MSHLETINLPQLQRNLRLKGLNLCSVFSAKMLADVLPNIALPSNTGNLILIGNAGSALWDSMPAKFLGREHPVDEYTLACVSQSLTMQIPSSRWQLLYPFNSELNIPLQELGALAGWHHASPLGIGINQRHGLWFAYRALVMVDCDIIESVSETDSHGAGVSSNQDRKKPWQSMQESPCLNCRDTPCLSACPANALEVSKVPNLRACVTHRCEAQSSCASTCLARKACPVAPEYQYTDDQISYFYDRSLLSAKRWIAESGYN